MSVYLCNHYIKLSIIIVAGYFFQYSTGALPEKCKKDPDPGKCKAMMKRFYFDQSLDECIEFTWGGCGGNDNRFKSIRECDDVCDSMMSMDEEYPQDDQDVVLLSPPQQGKKQKKKKEPDCHAPKYDGPCRADIDRWFFSWTEKKCKEFSYGGCKGNGNNFETEEECNMYCDESAAEGMDKTTTNKSDDDSETTTEIVTTTETVTTTEAKKKDKKSDKKKSDKKNSKKG